VNPAEAPPTKGTFIQEPITSKTSSRKISSGKEIVMDPSKKDQPSTIAEADEDGTMANQGLRKSIESTHMNLGINFSTGFDAAVHPMSSLTTIEGGVCNFLIAKR
jgi:hypothetical protein